MGRHRHYTSVRDIRTVGSFFELVRLLLVSVEQVFAVVESGWVWEGVCPFSCGSPRRVLILMRHTDTAPKQTQLRRGLELATTGSTTELSDVSQHKFIHVFYYLLHIQEISCVAQ